MRKPRRGRDRDSERGTDTQRDSERETETPEMDFFKGSCEPPSISVLIGKLPLAKDRVNLR